MNQNISEVREIVAGILVVPVERVDCHCALWQLPEWDSMALMTLLMVLEERTGWRLSIDQLSRSTSVADVAEMLHRLRPTLH